MVRHTFSTLLFFSFFIAAFGQPAIEVKEYQAQLQSISADDQKYRNAEARQWMDKEERIQLQLALDQKNREKLDGLYKLYGFPKRSEMGKEAVLVPLLILHHSEDCEWNGRWTGIVLEHYPEIVDYKALMKHFFERTYGSEGHCKEYAGVLNDLKATYSSILEELGVE